MSTASLTDVNSVEFMGEKNKSSLKLPISILLYSRTSFSTILGSILPPCALTGKVNLMK